VEFRTTAIGEKGCGADSITDRDLHTFLNAEWRRHLQAVGRSAAWRNRFPLEWDGYTPFDKLPPLPKLKEHKPVTLTTERLHRVAGHYALSADTC
jgi:hypothetical protein